NTLVGRCSAQHGSSPITIHPFHLEDLEFGKTPRATESQNVTSGTANESTRLSTSPGARQTAPPSPFTKSQNLLMKCQSAIPMTIWLVQGTENGKNYAVGSGGLLSLALSVNLNFDVALLSDAGPYLLGSKGSVYGLEHGIYESENITNLTANLSDHLTDYLQTADPVSISINNTTVGGNVTIDNVSIIPSTDFQTETYIQVI
ncbi:hypothetical protein CSUB01_12047, partial [Colletotrichum sublineola]